MKLTKKLLLLCTLTAISHLCNAMDDAAIEDRSKTEAEKILNFARLARNQQEGIEYIKKQEKKQLEKETETFARSAKNKPEGYQFLEQEARAQEATEQEEREKDAIARNDQATRSIMAGGCRPQAELRELEKRFAREKQEASSASKRCAYQKIFIGGTAAAIGYLWCQGCKAAESIICENTIEPCTGEETYKHAAQGFMMSGAFWASLGVIDLLRGGKN